MNSDSSSTPPERHSSPSSTNDYGGTSSASPQSDHARDLEFALGQVLQELEGEGRFEREQQLARFPQWTQELNEFIDDWLAIERRTAQLGATSPAGSLDEPARSQADTLGDYLLLEEIGRGGMGVIYKARQQSLDRIVAIKQINNSRQEYERFRVEAEAAASLHHENIVSIYEVGEQAGQPFLSMQYISGGNLRDHAKGRPLDSQRAARLVEVIARAVHYAHQRGILHRDLKPANVLIDEQGKPYVTDFGLAKQLGNSSEITRSGAVLGTPGYMSPEQAMGQVKSLTVATDVYGLGAILYALLTGDAPFQGDSDLKTLRQVIEESPVSPRVRRPEIDRNIETVCLKCLEKLPQSRYPSAESLANDLARYLQGQPVDARPVGRLEQQWRWARRHPALSLLSLAVVASLAITFTTSILLARAESRAVDEFKRSSGREMMLQKEVERSVFAAEKKAQRITAEFAELYLGNGMRAADANLCGEAILWFAGAARLPGAEPRVVRTNAIRCASWIESSPQPIAAKRFDVPLSADFAPNEMICETLHPLPAAMIGRGFGDLEIWNTASDDSWQARSQGLIVSSAAWSSAEQLIGLGCPNGEVRVLDSSDFEVLANFIVNGPVSQLAFDRQGSTVAVAFDQTVQRFELAGGRALGPALVLESKIANVGFGADGRWLVVTAEDNRCYLFPIPTNSTKPSLIIETPATSNFESTPAFTPFISDSCETLFVGSIDGSVRAIDPQTGDELCPPLTCFEAGPIFHSKDGGQWLTCSEAGVRLWHFTSTRGSDAASFQHAAWLPHPNRLTSAQFTTQGLLVTACEDQTVRLWRAAPSEDNQVRGKHDRTPMAVLPHTDHVTHVRISDDNEQLSTMQQDGLLRVWSIPSFESPGYRIEVPQGGTHVKCTDEGWLVSGMTRWTGHMINASVRRYHDGQVLAETPLARIADRGHLLDAALDRERNGLLTLHAAASRSELTMLPKQGRPAGQLIVWDVRTGVPKRPAFELDAEPRSIATHPQQPIVAVLTADGKVSLFDASTYASIGTLDRTARDAVPDFASVVRPNHFRNGQLAFGHDGQSLFVWGLGHELYSWNLETKQLQFVFAAADNERIHEVELCPYGKTLALVWEQSVDVTILDASTGEVLDTIRHPGPVTAIDFRQNGDQLLTGCEDGRARLIDLNRDRRVYFQLAHDDRVIDAAYSPDGLLAATLAGDGEVRVWHTEDGSPAVKPTLVSPDARQVLFAPDSSCLIVAGLAREIKVLDLTAIQQPFETDFEQVQCLAELLSAAKLTERGLTPMTSADWLQAWHELAPLPGP